MSSPYRIDETSKVPLYFQIQEVIRRQIEEGVYAPGQCIPSESELQKLYGVSRITVRNAIEGLVFEDLLVKKRGIGTLVAGKRYSEDVSSLKSFAEKVLDIDASANTQVLEVGYIGASRRIAKHLQVEPETDVLHIKRLRFIDDIPIALFSSYIPGSIGISPEHDFRGSIYALLENDFGITIKEAEKVIEATQASGEEAKLLQVNTGESLLLVLNTTFDANGKPVEYAEGLYRSDRYRYVVRLKR
jgi:GntR family transcriptional regulator